MSLGNSLGRKEPVSYVILIKCERPVFLSIKSLNNPRLEEGIYIYLGSANLSNPMKRVLRHFKKVKRLRWHIDYLTSSCTALASLLIKGLAEKDLYNSLLSISTEALSDADLLIKPSIGKFGASDSIGHKTHLFKVVRERDIYAITTELLKVFSGIKAVSKVDVLFR